MAIQSIAIQEIEEDMGNSPAGKTEAIPLREAECYTVRIKDPSDVAKIRETGVLVTTLEPDYAVVLGDRNEEIRAEASIASSRLSFYRYDYEDRLALQCESGPALLEELGLYP